MDKSKLIPAWLLDHLRRLRNLPPASRLTYTRMQLARSLSRPSQRWSGKSIHSILFVCHGNIIRSPMAAALLKQHLGAGGGESVNVSSAGLWAVSGRGADPRAVSVAQEFGLSLQEHRAQLLTMELAQGMDAICVMDYLNEAETITRFPAARQKTFLLGAVVPVQRGESIEIPDPYGEDLDAVRRCYCMLESRVRNLADRIRSAGSPCPPDV